MPDRTAVETDFQVAPTGRNLYRRGELLVDSGTVTAVKQRLRELGHDLRGEDHDQELDVSCLRLARDPDIGRVVDDLKSQGFIASPNHLVGPFISPVTGQPEDMGGPSGRPTPLAPPPFASRTRLDLGAHVTVGVLDTRIADHPWLAGAFHSVVPDDNETPRGLDSDGDGVLDGEAAHATFVTGVVLQYAPGARVLVHHVLDSSGVGDVRTLARGIRAMLKRGVDILNLSVGCFTRYDRPPLALTRALANIPSGTIVVAAAGNHDPDDRSVSGQRPFWPAAFAPMNEQVVSVGALGNGDSGAINAAFSNSGKWVRAWAPGAGVASTYVTFRERTGVDFEGWATWNGTSFATPAVAGAVASAMSRDGGSAAAAWKVLASRPERIAVVAGDRAIIVKPELAVEPSVGS